MVRESVKLKESVTVWESKKTHTTTKDEDDKDST